MSRSAVVTGLSFVLAVAGLTACNSSNSNIKTQTGTAGTGSGSSGTSGAAGRSGQAGGGTGNATGPGAGTWIGGAQPGAPVTTSYPCATCAAFPTSTTKACDAATLPAPTISYPPDGVLLPPNMNVLEVQFVPNSDATLFEVAFTNTNTNVTVETSCLPVPDVRGGASRGCGVTLSQQAWNDIANNNREAESVSISVRATKDGSCVSSSKDTVRIAFAKENLAGGIYYWQAGTYGGVAGKTGGIYSHDFGSFDPTPTPFYTSGTSGTCVGCHNVSRDGERMAVEIDDPDADDEMGDVKAQLMDITTRSIIGASGAGAGKDAGMPGPGMAPAPGMPPAPGGPGGMGNLSPGFQTFTHDHSKMIASTYKTKKNQAFAVFSGDGALLSTQALPSGVAATQPDLSPDDATLAYVVPKAGTISMAGDHHFLFGSIFTSTFDVTSNALGAPTSVLQAGTAANFYYPSFSPTGSFLVLNTVSTSATASDDSFYHRRARVTLLHYPAGASPTPIELPVLNDTAEGDFANSWPKWSPFVQTYRGHKVLWLTFSSNRDYGLHLVNHGFDSCYPPESPTYDMPQPLSKQGVTYNACAQPQIWMAAVIVDEDPSLDAKDRSFPAFWLPFQDVNAHNHTAQWVAKIASTPTPDGGTPADGGACYQGMTCGTAGGGVCCSALVCCEGSCQDTCDIIP